MVEPLNGALNCTDFALIKVRLTALVSDPGWDCIEHQVIAIVVNVEGCLRALHLAMTVDAVHCDQNQSDSLGTSRIFQDSICRMATFQVTRHQQNFTGIQALPLLV